jgi:Organic Anion Transporter Polypeptide (OATP) family
MIGPTFGYMFASYSVGIFIEPNKTPMISDVDPRWVGAWWLGIKES